MPIFGELHPIEDGYLLLTPRGVAEDFAQDLTPLEKQTMAATQAATQGAVLTTKIGKAAWHDKPSWVVIAANDRAIAPEQQKFTAKRMGSKTLTLPTSHVAMLARPNEVANFIIQAAASTAVATADEVEVLALQ